MKKVRSPSPASTVGLRPTTVPGQMPHYSEGQLAPIVLETLIEVHITGEKLKAESAPAVVASLEVLLRHELIQESAAKSSGWRTTGRGKAYIGMLCALPFPVLTQQWVHPLTKEALQD